MRALAALLVASTLFGCSSNDANGNEESVGGSARTGGSQDGSGANGGAGGSGGSGGTAGGAGGSGGQPIDVELPKLHLAWETGELSGTTFTAKTCEQLGADTVGVHVSGATIEATQNHYSTNAGECATGERVEEWPFGLGSFWIRIGLYPGAFQTDVPIVGGGVPFTVEAGQTDIFVNVKVVYARYAVTWSIEQGGSPVTCEAAAAQTVEIKLLQQLSEISSIETTWSPACNESGVGSPPLYPGTYQLSAQLSGDAGPLATWAATEELVITADAAPPFPEIEFTLP